MLRLADAAIGAYERRQERARRPRFRGPGREDRPPPDRRPDAARWVHYKLDRGLDHILVDEAQDTSPRQWQVVRALVEEFFAGEGAAETVRTLFAVGDEKQSIFSFQGAVPAWFARMRDELRRPRRGAGLGWTEPQLHLSFRSVQKVLAAVDTVFGRAAVHRGLAGNRRRPVHSARAPRGARPGRPSGR